MIVFGQQTINDSIIHDNLYRSYITYIPAIYNTSQPTPLVFNFHGLTGSSLVAMWHADFRSIADTANFILVYPQGTFGSTWNSSLPTNPRTKMFVDDFGFVDAMIKKIKECSFQFLSF